MSTKTEKKTKFDDMDFEGRMARVEEIAELMDQGSMSLEESLRAYEEGVKLAAECQNILSKAERRLKILSEKNKILQSEEVDLDDADGV